MSKFKAGQFWRSRGEGNFVLDEVEDHCIRGHRVSDNMKVAWFPDGQLHPGKETAYDLMAKLPEATTGPREIHDPEYDGSNYKLVSIHVRVPQGYEVSGPDSVIRARSNSNGSVAAHCPIVSIEPVDAPRPYAITETGTEPYITERRLLDSIMKVNARAADTKAELLGKIDRLERRMASGFREAVVDIAQLDANIQRQDTHFDKRCDGLSVRLDGAEERIKLIEQRALPDFWHIGGEYITVGNAIERLVKLEKAVHPATISDPGIQHHVHNTSQAYRVDYDGFVGTIIGSYTTREGKAGAVLQAIGSKVVHVYRAEHLKETVVF